VENWPGTCHDSRYEYSSRVPETDLTVHQGPPQVSRGHHRNPGVTTDVQGPPTHRYPRGQLHWSPGATTDLQRTPNTIRGRQSLRRQPRRISWGAKRAAGPKLHKGPHSCPETATGLQGSLVIRYCYRSPRAAIRLLVRCRSSDVAAGLYGAPQQDSEVSTDLQGPPEVSRTITGLSTPVSDTMTTASRQ
jgi:hypothetical protein